jgi:opacity protein-like surface antigen
VQAGLGWTYIDSNVSDGRPTTGCWWDPWWGYVCADFYDTYDDNRFSYGAGAGLRYEFRNGMFVKGSYNLLELDGEGNGADPSFDLWRLELGWKLGGW